MRQDRKILISSIVAFFLLALYGVYLRYFPVIISPLITNILFIGLVVALSFLLVYQPFHISRPLDTYLLLPQYLLFAFLVRAAPTLRFAYQPLDDPNFYAVATFNINEFGTLKPLFSGWYSQVMQQLTWPYLHILGANFMQVSGINSIDVLRLSTPLYGIFFFLGVFLLARIITNNSTVAFLSGLFASTADTVISLQAQYIPQGFAFVLFAFFVYLLFRDTSFRSIPNVFSVLILLLALALSHHFSSLFLAILSVYMAIALISIPNLTKWADGRIPPLPQRNASFFWLLSGIILIFSHFYNYTTFLGVVSNSVEQVVQPIGQLITIGSTIPIQVTVLNTTKYLLLVLAIPSILYVLKTKNRNEFLALVFLAGVVVSGVVGTYVAFIPVDRLIGFYVPFAAIFASLTLYRFKREWFSQINSGTKMAGVISIALVILVAAQLNCYPPAVLLHDTPKDSYYWYSNDYSSFSSLGVPGYWIKNFSEQSATFTSFGSTYATIFLYGQISDLKITRGSDISSSDYYVIEASYFSGYESSSYYHSFLEIYSANTLYHMGRFRIGSSG